MQLTWDEAKVALHEAFLIEPEDFVRKIADSIPQTVIDDLMTELVLNYAKHEDDPEDAVKAAVHTMIGFQLGWFLALRTVK